MDLMVQAVEHFTIGKVYESNPSVDSVIRYLNGLGKAFRRNGWNDKRHWSQRAWTLQEVSGTFIEAGLSNGAKDLKETDDNGTPLRDHLKRSEIIASIREMIGLDLHDDISAMRGRHSQNHVDKIFGLSALLGCASELIAYSKDEAYEEPEQAWARLLTHTGDY